MLTCSSLMCDMPGLHARGLRDAFSLLTCEFSYFGPWVLVGYTDLTGIPGSISCGHSMAWNCYHLSIYLAVIIIPNQQLSPYIPA